MVVPNVTEMSPHDVYAALSQDSIVLVDCREPDEWEIARIDGATLLPMSELEARIGDFRPEGDRPVIVYCHHGVRSRHVAAALQKTGLPDVRSMAGGIDAWSIAVDPSVPRY